MKVIFDEAATELLNRLRREVGGAEEAERVITRIEMTKEEFGLISHECVIENDFAMGMRKRFHGDDGERGRTFQGIPIHIVGE